MNTFQQENAKTTHTFFKYQEAQVTTEKYS